MVNIEFKYKKVNKEWKIIKYYPEEYFDLEEDEEIMVDCVPMHMQPIDYIKDNHNKVTNIVTKIKDDTSLEEIIITQNYWSAGHNSIFETKYNNVQLNENWHQLIISFDIKNDPETCEVIILVKENGVWIPREHTIDTTTKDRRILEVFNVLKNKRRTVIRKI